MTIILSITLLVLLVLNIIIAVMIIRLLKSLRRGVNLAKAVINEVESFTKVFQKIKLPLAAGRILKKIIGYLPNDSKGKKKD